MYDHPSPSCNLDLEHLFRDLTIKFIAFTQEDLDNSKLRAKNSCDSDGPKQVTLDLDTHTIPILHAH